MERGSYTKSKGTNIDQVRLLYTKPALGHEPYVGQNKSNRPDECLWRKRQRKRESFLAEISCHLYVLSGVRDISMVELVPDAVGVCGVVISGLL